MLYSFLKSLEKFKDNLKKIFIVKKRENLMLRIARKYRGYKELIMNDNRSKQKKM